MLSAITPLVLTFNERENLPRSLARLDWASQIIIIDSVSTDETPAIAQGHPNVTLVKRAFDDHTAQWNFGLAQVKTDWVLALDADYILTPSFISELRALAPPVEVTAYYARFIYCVAGQPLRASLYPPRAVLFRRGRARYSQDGHTQFLQAEGETAFLASPIEHDDRKPLSRWLSAQAHYACLEAQKLTACAPEQLRFPDRIRRRIVLAPVLVFFYTLFWKGLVLDGWRGWFYVFQRTLAEMLLSLRLLEAKFNRDAGTTGPRDDGNSGQRGTRNQKADETS